ncbi:MAG: hypothetical protein JO170_22440 [Verrucomicrobia bacterium]|nr:hypothetical protein [Verrucomicrobiota bacterium]
MISKQLAEFRNIVVRLKLTFCRSGRPARCQYLFPGKSRGAELARMTSTAGHLFKGTNSFVDILAGGPDLKGSLQKAKSLAILAATAGFFGRLNATNASIDITVSAVKKIGCFLKSIATATKQFSHLLTETPFSGPWNPAKELVAKFGIYKLCTVCGRFAKNATIK